MRVFMLTACLFVSFMPSLFGQFNDTTNYYVNLTSTGVVNKTNAGNSYLLNNNVKFNIYKKNYSLNTTNGWIFGEQRNIPTNNDFLSILDFNLFKSGRGLYYWGLVNFEKSLSLKINYRVQSGAGIGYYLIDRESFVLQVSDGILYDKGDLYDTEMSNNNYQTIRNSFRLKFRLVANDVITLESSDFLQHSLEDVEDYILKLNANLSLKLLQWLRFTTTVNYNKLSVTDNENLFCNIGLTVEKYF